MKQALPRNNFSSGIISQQLSGRIDLPAFSNGLKNIENFDINLNGSLSRRTGYELMGVNETVKDCTYVNCFERTVNIKNNRHELHYFCNGNYISFKDGGEFINGDYLERNLNVLWYKFTLSTDPQRKI